MGSDMNEDLKKRASDALKAGADAAKKIGGIACDLGKRGYEAAKDGVKNYREAHREPSADEASRDGSRRIYGVENLALQSTGFRAFNAFRLMIAPMLIRIAWIIGAYIVYPIRTFSILNDMSKSRYFDEGDMWKVFGISLVALILFRLSLECLMMIFRIHESSTKTTELVGRLVRIAESRNAAEHEGNVDA